MAVTSRGGNIASGSGTGAAASFTLASATAGDTIVAIAISDRGTGAPTITATQASTSLAVTVRRSTGGPPGYTVATIAVPVTGSVTVAATNPSGVVSGVFVGAFLDYNCAGVPVDVQVTLSTSTSTSLVVPAATGAQGSGIRTAMVATGYVAAGAPTLTAPTGISAAKLTSVDNAAASFYNEAAGAGNTAVPTRTFTSSVATTWVAVSILMEDPQPAWAPTTTATGGTATWTADFTKTDVVAAGYQNVTNDRQAADGSYVTDAAVMPWPMPIEAAPWGSPAGTGAARSRMPDGMRRNEMQPNVPTWRNGQGIYVGMSIAVDPDMDRFQAGLYQTIWQLRPDNFGGSPPVSLEVGQGTGHLWATGGYGRSDGSTATQYQWSQDLGLTIDPCTWYPIVVFVGVWADPNSGRFCVWDARTDTLLLDLVPPCGTNYPQGNGGTYDVGDAYPKNGIYHSGSLRGATYRIREHRQGSSYQAVKPQLATSEWRGEPALRALS